MKTEKNQSLLLKIGSDLLKIPFNSIHRLEAYENYTSLITIGKTYTICERLGIFMLRLPDELFVRVHKSHSVNIDKIKYLSGRVLYLETPEGEMEIPVGDTYKNALLQHFYHSNGGGKLLINNYLAKNTKFIGVHVPFKPVHVATDGVHTIYLEKGQLAVYIETL